MTTLIDRLRDRSEHFAFRGGDELALLLAAMMERLEVLEGGDGTARGPTPRRPIDGGQVEMCPDRSGAICGRPRECYRLGCRAELQGAQP